MGEYFHTGGDCPPYTKPRLKDSLGLIAQPSVLFSSVISVEA